MQVYLLDQKYSSGSKSIITFCCHSTISRFEWYLCHVWLFICASVLATVGDDRFLRCIDRSVVHADRFMSFHSLPRLLFCVSCYHHHFCHLLIYHYNILSIVFIFCMFLLNSVPVFGHLLGLSYVIRKDLLWSKAWNGKWAQNWQI